MNLGNLHADSPGSVLVAGSGGFIGRRLVALLRRFGLEAHAPSSRECDLRRPRDTRRLLDALRPQVVVNLARPTHAGDSGSDHAGHAEIAANLLAAARHAGARRLIQLGSSTEFGNADSPVDDDASLRPTTPFGRAKAEASSLVLSADGQEIRTSVLRPFGVYGPGDRPTHLIPVAIEAAFSGRRLPLAQGAKRDWGFVDDVARGCALALDGGADGLAVNLGSGMTVPNERVVELIEDLTGRPIDADHGAIPSRPWDAGLAGSTERARRTLGWVTETDLTEGIRRTLAEAGHESRMATAG